jgi:hypothetical protein
MFKKIILLVIGFIAGTVYGIFFAVEVPDTFVIKAVQVIKAFIQ